MLTRLSKVHANILADNLRLRGFEATVKPQGFHAGRQVATVEAVVDGETFTIEKMGDEVVEFNGGAIALGGQPCSCGGCIECWERSEDGTWDNQVFGGHPESPIYW